MIRSVDVRVVPRGEMAYETLDDYRVDDDKLDVHIADVGNDVYTRLILIHALVEQLISDRLGISEPVIRAYDLGHPESVEPGDNPDAPYRDAHSIAVGIERVLCGAIGLSWRQYEQDLEGFFGPRDSSMAG